MMKRFAFILLLVIIFTSCFNLNKISLYNLSNLYNTINFTELKAVAFNPDTQKANIFIYVHRADLAVKEDESSGFGYQKYRITYELFESYESKQILDSSSVTLVDSSIRISDTLLILDINYPDKKKYVLSLKLTDLNRVDEASTFLCLDNTSTNSPDNYLLKDKDGELLFTNILPSDEKFSLLVSDSLSDKLIVRYYNREFPLALPPFMEETNMVFEYKADSIFVVDIVQGVAHVTSLPEEGFYHFQTDSNQRNGFTVYRYGDGFPLVRNTSQMLEPLRYITSRKEFKELEEASNRKLAIDNFWLNNSGNPTRARAMIQKYYGRVEDANTFFSSYLEGWKTDRGLIYIVYGPPRFVFRSENLEEWIYGEKGNKNSIRFKFVKVPNPFSENDYSLIKSPTYKERWYHMVNNWRR